MTLITRLGLPLLEFTSRTRFWTLYREMLAFDGRPEVDRLAVQARSLSALLGHAASSVPDWREQFDRLGVRPGEIVPADAHRVLADLPVTTKERIRAGFPRRVT